MGRLGLSDRKPVPDPVNWDEQDPLGSKTISNVFSQTDPLAPISKNLCHPFLFLFTHIYFLVCFLDLFLIWFRSESVTVCSQITSLVLLT